jgi:hypothetical protein
MLFERFAFVRALKTQGNAFVSGTNGFIRLAGMGRSTVVLDDLLRELGKMEEF